MSVPRPTGPQSHGRVTDGRSPFTSALPLMFVTGGCFAASLFAYLDFRATGPGHFPLWGLLLTLGIVAAIGAVVCVFLGVDELESPDSAADGTDSAGQEMGHGFGRPAPDVAARREGADLPSRAVTVIPAIGGVAESWAEDILPPVAPHGPRPILTTLEDPGGIGRVLEEIAEIQRQLIARSSPANAPLQAPARA